MVDKPKYSLISAAVAVAYNNMMYVGIGTYVLMT